MKELNRWKNWKIFWGQFTLFPWTIDQSVLPGGPYKTTFHLQPSITSKSKHISRLGVPLRFTIAKYVILFFPHTKKWNKIFSAQNNEHFSCLIMEKSNLIVEITKSQKKLSKHIIIPYKRIIICCFRTTNIQHKRL